MNQFDPSYNNEQLHTLCVQYRRKSAVMKEICDGRHDTSLRRATIRDFITLSASVLLLALTFFGTEKLATTINITEDNATIIISIVTFLLVASSIWQLSSDRVASFQNYRGVQEFASIQNKIEYITNGQTLDDATATYWAKEITSLYDSAARDIPRITDKEHAAAKKRIK